MKFKVSNLIAIQAIAITSFTILPVMAAAFFPKATVAQGADVNVRGPNVNCEETNTRANAPNVSVSAPNPSRLVPNVGKILRKGVGVPAPDTEAPNVTTPKVSTSARNAECADVNRNSNYQTAPNNESSPTQGDRVQGLW